MRDKIKKFLKKYDSLSSIDGILCGILIFALLRSPWNYVGVITLMIMAVIAFGANTLSRTETDEKRRRRKTVGLHEPIFFINGFESAFSIPLQF